MPDEEIAVVVDPTFGARLLEVTAHAHAWICRTEENEKAVDSVWALGDACHSATIFNISLEATPEEQLFWELHVIHEHHPSWRMMEVYGAALTPPLEEALRVLGASDFQITADGFITTRASTSIART